LQYITIVSGSSWHCTRRGTRSIKVQEIVCLHAVLLYQLRQTRYSMSHVYQRKNIKYTWNIFDHWHMHVCDIDIVLQPYMTENYMTGISTGILYIQPKQYIACPLSTFMQSNKKMCSKFCTLKYQSTALLKSMPRLAPQPEIFILFVQKKMNNGRFVC
jgi:hypothetical protein